MADKREAVSLVDYVKKMKQADCPVCQLPGDVRAQLRSATDKGIRRPVQLAWLNDELGVPITDGQLTSHYSGKHDDGA